MYTTARTKSFIVEWARNPFPRPTLATQNDRMNSTREGFMSNRNDKKQYSRQ